jgi:hypothetical protein
MKKGRDPFKVRLGAERHATGLAHELEEIDDISVQHNGRWWEVVIGSVITDQVVVSVLDGLRRTLAEEPATTAVVFLDGREYQFEGD